MPTLFQTALKTIANRHSWTALAEMSGVQRTTLNNYAAGRSRPSVESIKCLADCLPTDERAELVLAHLQDECPASAKHLLAINATQSPSPPLEQRVVDLDSAITALRAHAMRNPEVADWLILTAQLLG